MFRINPYLQQPSSDGMYITWFTEENISSEVSITGPGLDFPLTFTTIPTFEPVLSYTTAELNQEIEGLEPGAWLLGNENYKHTVDLTGLLPDSTYEYSVTAGDNIFESSFDTAPTAEDWDKIRFVVLSDSETEPLGRVRRRDWQQGALDAESLPRPEVEGSLWAETIGVSGDRLNYPLTENVGYRNNLEIINSLEPDFMVMPGDLIQGGGYQPAWDEFFRHNAGEFDSGLSEYPILPALGNWENFGALNGGYETDEAGRFGPLFGRDKYHVYFDAPENGTPEHQDNYYRIDYGPVTILTLDSSNGEPDDNRDNYGEEGEPPQISDRQFTEPGTDTQENFTREQYEAEGGTDLADFNPGSPQWNWVVEQLESARAEGQIVFAQFHHAPYSNGTHGLPMNHENSSGQGGTPMRQYHPLFEEYGVVAVFSGHSEMFERSFVDRDNDGVGVYYYDVGVAGDGMRGERTDENGNLFSYNQFSQWTADQHEPELWQEVDGVLQNVAGGKHYGHLEVNLENLGEAEGTRITFTPVYSFPLLDANYNLIDTERRVYGDEIVIKIPEKQVTLRGFASLPADTFAEGPETGADIDTTRTGPFPGQPVGGWSGVQFADQNSYWFIVDSLFGGNSDTLARIYQVDPNFAGTEGGDGSVAIESFITLSEPNNLVPFEIRNEDDPQRPLTGKDFDPEALVIDSNGDLWVGDEYGPYLLHFDQSGTLLEAPIPTPNIPQLKTLNGQNPINIGHRGASGPLPEHTLAGFQLALEQGADFIETDYVMTKDGVPLVRHEPLLNNTTNILDHPEFSERETTKIIDGVEITGFFAEDLTLEEIKTLRARQPRPERSDEFDDLYEIPTMAEVIQLVKDFEAETGKQVGIVHELKHNSYFDSIGLNVEEATVRVLLEEDFTNPEQNIIQTFQVAPLIRLNKEIMPEAGIDLPLHQLTGAATENSSPGFSFPYDLVDNFSNPDFTAADARAVYGDLVDLVDLSGSTGYGDLLALPEFYQFMSTYAKAVNPWKNTILLREGLDEPVDGDGDGNAEIRSQLTGEVFPLIEYAHDAGLLVNVYTLRDEERYLTLNPDGTVQTPQQEVEDLIRLGSDGLIGDFPATVEDVLDRILADEVRSPQNPDVEAGEAVSNLRGSRGFEGIGYSPDRTKLYPILEAPVDGDPENSLRIYEYDMATGTYSDELVGLYPLSDSGDTPTFQLGDLTPINEREFLAIERDDFQAEEAFFKKIFKIDISQIDENGLVKKTELVDLLDLADPDDLDGNGSTDFTLPITSVEDLLVIDERTILVAVDNNYPFGDFATGRPPELDNNEIILLELPEPLDLDPRLGVAGVDLEPLDLLTGSLREFIGFKDGSYFIEVPDGQIDEFFSWNIAYPQLVSAHRGGFLPGFPENALATFEKTLTNAPALLEVDVRRTADGEWILMHDDDLSRTTNGTGLVAETTLAEIQTLQLKDNQGNLTPYQVPTLQEAILWAEGKTILELDLKSDDFTQEVVEIITELNGEDQVRFITDSVEQATEIYNLNPEIHLGLFIIPDNQETVLTDLETAPFGLDKVSAFTGTQPQSAEFYADLHARGLVAIQGLFGTQSAFEDTTLDRLSDAQRESLFESVYANGGDAIASDYYQQIGSIIGYPEEEDKLDILLVNDDGFEAEGINVLFDGLTAAGYDVTLVAPKEQQSGQGTFLNVDKIFQPTEVVKFAENKWFVDASPVVTTLAGLGFILEGKEPDLVISGINEGANIGENIAISSGTVSAATTATRKGIPALAVSAGGNTEAELDAVYEAGTEFVIELIEELEAKQAEGEELLPQGVGLSVNIPGTFAEGVDGIQGVALTQLDTASNINLSFGELPEGFGEGAGVLFSFNENIAPDEINNPTSEGENFLAGKITVTPIDGSWVADSTVREAISSRATAEIAITEVTSLDILLTNDDGFDAEGIEVIYNALTEAGHNVTLVAPREQQSGTGTALDVDAILQPTEFVNFEEENKWFVDAGVRTTTWAGLDFILEDQPDLVISGINEGENIGRGGAVSSGTVSAAVTAILRDVPAIAVSAGIDLTAPERTATKKAYEIGADYITNLIAQLQATQGEEPNILPARTGLSINVPLEAELERVKFTEPDEIDPFILDFGELPQGGAGLRFAPFERTLLTRAEFSEDSLSEGFQFLTGNITVTALDGNWTADEKGIADIGARLADLRSEPEPIFDAQAQAVTVRELEFIGESSIPSGLIFADTEVGGLSGLTYDANQEVYYAISDDLSNINPARFYTLDIDLSDGSLNRADVSVVDVTTLINEDNLTFPAESLDPEGIVLTNHKTLYISSEGNTEELVNPFVNEFSLEGEQLQALEIPAKFLPTADRSSGIRDNLAFESLTIDPTESFLYAGIENALFQDGEAAGIEQTSLARIIQYDLTTREARAEFVYETDNANPPEGTPDSVDRTNSIAELLALDNAGTFLALERYFDDTGLNQNKLYLVSAQNATDVSKLDSLEGQELTVAEKQLLVDFNDLGSNLDDFEGLALGPKLPDGRQSLIVVSDNDFDPATPATQIFAFALDIAPITETPEPIFGSLEADVLEISDSNKLIFAGEDNDLIDTSLAEGNNRIYGDGGDDTFILGTGDRLVGAAGDDIFYTTTGGNNTITGGEGADQFWIAVAEIPASANTLTDFELDVDVLGVAGLGISFEHLIITQEGNNALVSIEGENLAILLNTNADSLNRGNFVFV